MKYCSNCKVDKSEKEFYKSPTNRTLKGLQSQCKECVNKKKKDRLRTKKGLAIQIYQMQVANSKKRGHPLPTYSKEELTTWMFNHPNFSKLYANWVNSDYDRYSRPSVDRWDNSKGYSFSTIDLTDWRTNNSRQSYVNTNGKLLQIFDNLVIDIDQGSKMLMRIITDLLELNRKELEVLLWHINELLNNKGNKDE